MVSPLYEYPSDRFLYNFAHRWASLPLIYLSRAELYRMDRLPMSGSLLIAANHSSYLDPIYLGAAIPREVNFMAKHTLFAPPFGRFLRQVGAYPINRSKADISSVRHSLRLLKSGQAIVMFPEGTRAVSEDEQLEAQRGIGLLAERTGSPVQPVYLDGASAVWGRGRLRLRRRKVRIYFGEPQRYQKGDDHMEIAKTALEAIAELRGEAEGGRPSAEPSALAGMFRPQGKR